VAVQTYEFNEDIADAGFVGPVLHTLFQVDQQHLVEVEDFFDVGKYCCDLLFFFEVSTNAW
jgi:hypothetical protein